MIFNSATERTRNEVIAGHLYNLKNGEKKFAILPVQIKKGQTVWLGSYYTYVYGLYFTSDKNGFKLDRYIYGGWEDAGYCVNYSIKPEDRAAVRIEVNKKELLGQEAIDWFEANLSKIY